MALGLLASQPSKYSHVLRPAIMTGPEARMYNTPSTIFRTLASIPFGSSIIANMGGIFPPPKPMQQFVLNTMCQAAINPLCREGLRIGASLNSDNHDKSRFAVILNHFPQTTSAQTFAYLIQASNSKKFFKFDYGPDNERIYGQVSAQCDTNFS